MDLLFEISRRLLQATPNWFVRSIYNTINWDAKLIEITGSRGVGKTTLMLQYIKANYTIIDTSVLYISLDDPYFYSNSLISTIDTFVKYGGKHIFIDEVHKYTPQQQKSDWSREIKAAYDRYPKLKIVYSGSSIIKIYKGLGDLSRRISSYKLNGLSFREYLEFNKFLKFRTVSLSEIIKNHIEIANEIIKQIVILQHFHKYLSVGYYAFYKENADKYFDRLRNVISTILETDIPSVIDIPFSNVERIKKLLAVITTSSPYTPNLQTIGKNIGITDQRTLLKYMTYLEKAEIVTSLSKDVIGNQILRKPAKLYLNNTNLCYAIERQNINKGTLREIFFYNQLNYENSVTLPPKADFLINEKYTFEIGGKNKNQNQIFNIENAFLAVDNIEVGLFNKIPIWLFGFMY